MWILILILGGASGLASDVQFSRAGSLDECELIAEEARNVVFTQKEVDITYIMHFCVREPLKRRWEIIGDPDTVQALRHAGDETRY